MNTFLETVLDDLEKQGHDTTQLTYVVPSKRVGVFLGKFIARRLEQPTFMPPIMSVEDFIEKCSGLTIYNDLDLLSLFYQAYRTVEEGNGPLDSFDEFLGWAPTILKDFNEIDRYLVDAEEFFSYLGNAKELDQWHWSLDPNPTKMVSNYLRFWKKLYLYYAGFQQLCKEQNIAYQGMAYRWAAEAITQNRVDLFDTQEVPVQTPTLNKPHSKIVFLGLNALNTAESQIIQHLLEEEQALIYWDVDQYLLDQSHHEAGKFVKKFKNDWKYYQSNELKLIGQHYNSDKQIELKGVAGNLGVVQVAAQMLSTIPEEELKNTAVILADERLLLPLLDAIPENVKSFNVTMGLSAEQLPTSTLVNDLIQLYLGHTEQGFYYRDVVRLLESATAGHLLGLEGSALMNRIRKENLIYVNSNHLAEDKPKGLLKQLLQPIEQPNALIQQLENVLFELKNTLKQNSQSAFELEQLLAVTEVVQQLKEIVWSQTAIKDFKTISFLYRQLLSLKSLDFIGEPIKGLQIMGLLETRALDYENLIMLSVNEGVLPAGKTTASYISHDIKHKFGLPTYSEKDSIYAYHFYRLLHRVQKATYIFNTEGTALGGGEKSRFLTQLETDTHSKHQLRSEYYIYENKAVSHEHVSIDKDPSYVKRLNQIAQKGFSPSALTSYVRNPIDFYAQKILGISEMEEVEENIAANTMGSIIHEALDKLYSPYKNELLTEAHLKAMSQRIPSQLKLAYETCYANDNAPLGKNKIIYEVALYYVKKMVGSDLELVTAGKSLIIKDIERSLATTIQIDGIGAVKLHGLVDRIDMLDEELRIIDYKSGAVSKANLGIEPEDYSQLIEDYGKSKAFQVLMYTYLYSKNEAFDEASAGIISFKNFDQGYIPFGMKQGKGYKKQLINAEILNEFESVLISLIQEIFDCSQPLKEKQL